MDSTTYYNTNASKFIGDTVNADMSAIRDRFLANIPSGGTILDAGCGPGRAVYDTANPPHSCKPWTKTYCIR